MCVFCEKCETWFHQKRQKLTKDQFLILSHTKSCDFICTQCCQTKDHKFDYDLSLSRLDVYASKNLLTDGVKVEQILLRKEPHLLTFFYTHIASVLDTTITDTLLSYSNLVIGSDEEKALVKAIKDSFPTSELTLCTRHLSENVTRHLRIKVGVNDKNAKQILSDLFGDSGLIEADTTVDFYH
ncbi:unnamed protein product [Mytilus coruscus]|uniref:MULE transposase domain-containing protein n=1 Tax=Mytilus coruscus TaxID=42192 RepID=A0A6J8C826_MYTCO|nr:unnamed protein product [Mytilus coruscus]